MVKRIRCGSTSGLDEIEYCRGCRRVKASIQSCAGTATPDDRGHVDRLPAPRPAGDGLGFGRPGEQLQVAVTAALGEQPHEPRCDPGDLQVVAQGGTDRQSPDAVDLDGGVGVDAR